MTKRNYLKAPLLLVALIGCCCSLFAQDKSISGKVTDSKDGKPVPGVTVKLKNSSLATSTDSIGVFKITVPSAESIISISHVGYGILEVKAGAGNSPINISLVQQSSQLDDVVVIGYGTQKAKNVTGAIVSIDLKKVEDIPVSSITESLRGQVPGLNITGGNNRPGSNANASIRQQFNWGKDGGGIIPLVVIDDVIQVDPQSGLPTLDRFNMLDMSEVESITVLKDASAAIYGSRASQGALVVRTKRGKNGPPRISYSGKFENNDAVSHGKVMNAHEYGVYANRFGRSAGAAWTSGSYFDNTELTRMDSLNYDWLRNDWNSANALQQSINVSGGTDRATFFTGASYYTQGANLGSQDYTKWTYRAGTDVKVANGLHFSATVAANNSSLEKSFTKININDGSYGGGGEQNDYSMLLHMPKYIPWMYNIGGVDRFVSPAMGPQRVGTVSGNNSLGNWNYYTMLDNGSNTTTKSFGYNANFSLQYDIPFVKGLSAKVNYSIGSTTSNTEQVQMPLTLSLASNTNTAGNHLYSSTTAWNAPAINKSNSRVTYDNSVGNTEQINFYLSYDHNFGLHNVSALVSGERGKNTFDDRFQIYDSPIPGAYNGTSISAGTLNASNSFTSRYEHGNISYFGRLSYAYNSKYLAQFVFREDASSHFAPENYWGFFPSVSVGWVMSEENWFKDNVDWVSNLKIRASVGKTGNDNVKAWKWMQLYSAATDKGMGFGSNGGALVTGLTPEVSPNRDIRWDKTIQRNLGLDFSLFRSRLALTFDYYNNKSSDVLTLMSGAIGVPISVGGAFAEENYSGINAWGYEVSATWKGKAGQFNYSVGANFGMGDNNVTKYFDQPIDYPSKMTTRRQQGQSTIGPSWGFRTWKQTSGGDGILRTDADVDAYWAYLTNLATASGVAGAAPNFLGITNKAAMKKGMLVYEDIAGILDTKSGALPGPNGAILEEQDYIQLVKKNMSYGITTNLSASWKGFSFSAQISTSWGGVNRLDYIKQGTSSTQSMWAQPIFLNDMYDSTDNPNGKYPNLALYDNFKGTNSDFFTLPTFRCFVRSMSIGYSLPKDLVKKARMENVRVFISGNNLWDFYNAYPEKYRNMYDAPNVGYPTLRTWALGVNLGF